MSPRLLVGLILFAITSSAVPGAAHETRDAGPVSLVVGWRDEPAYVGFMNAVQVEMRRDGSPVEDVEDLRAMVRLGDERSDPLDLQPVGDGEYHAELVPTVPGAYTFEISGSIAGEEISETFTAGEGTFDEVRSPDAVTFPRDVPSGAELAAATEGLQGDVADLRERVDADLGTARTLGLLGVVLGGIALLVSVAALARGRR